MGVLSWTPDEFWNATPYELQAALDGWSDAHGAGPQAEPMTLEELEELCKLYPDD